jgi:hypothetical protein
MQIFKKFLGNNFLPLNTELVSYFNRESFVNRTIESTTNTTLLVTNLGLNLVNNVPGAIYQHNLFVQEAPPGINDISVSFSNTNGLLNNPQLIPNGGARLFLSFGNQELEQTDLTWIIGCNTVDNYNRTHTSYLELNLKLTIEGPGVYSITSNQTLDNGSGVIDILNSPVQNLNIRFTLSRSLSIIGETPSSFSVNIGIPGTTPVNLTIPQNSLLPVNLDRNIPLLNGGMTQMGFNMSRNPLIIDGVTSTITVRILGPVVPQTPLNQTQQTRTY